VRGIDRAPPSSAYEKTFPTTRKGQTSLAIVRQEVLAAGGREMKEAGLRPRLPSNEQVLQSRSGFFQPRTLWHFGKPQCRTVLLTQTAEGPGKFPDPRRPTKRRGESIARVCLRKWRTLSPLVSRTLNDEPPPCWEEKVFVAVFWLASNAPNRGRSSGCAPAEA